MAVTTLFPAPGTGGGSVDGATLRSGVSEDIVDILAGAGTGANNTATEGSSWLSSSGATDEYDVNQRMIFTLDRSSIPGGDSIDSAIFRVKGTAKDNGLGSPALHLVGANPATVDVLVAADYGTLDNTSFGNITYAGFNAASVYNDITVNASGLAAIAGAVVVPLGLVLGWDGISGSPTWAANADTFLQHYMADRPGTTDDPELEITHTAGGIAPLRRRIEGHA